MSLVDQKHAQERAYFDDQAAQAVIMPTDSKVIDRYSNPGQLYSSEFMFWLGNVSGKQVLDVACGEGENSIVMAKLGAHVTGVDLSPAAIDVTKRRFCINRAHGRFLVSSIEDVPEGLGNFDIVFVAAFLHHVLHDLENVLVSLRSRVRPGGTIIMAEPLDLFPGLRRLRLAIGPAVQGTPDERPLRRKDVQIMERVFPGLNVRYFNLFGRVARLLLPHGTYEQAGTTHRAVLDTLAVTDAVLGRVPLLQLASSCGVFWWNRPL